MTDPNDDPPVPFVVTHMSIDLAGSMLDEAVSGLTGVKWRNGEIVRAGGVNVSLLMPTDEDWHVLIERRGNPADRILLRNWDWQFAGNRPEDVVGAALADVRDGLQEGSHEANLLKTSLNRATTTALAACLATGERSAVVTALSHDPFPICRFGLVMDGVDLVAPPMLQELLFRMAPQFRCLRLDPASHADRTWTTERLTERDVPAVELLRELRQIPAAAIKELREEIERARAQSA